MKKARFLMVAVMALLPLLAAPYADADNPWKSVVGSSVRRTGASGLRSGLGNSIRSGSRMGSMKMPSRLGGSSRTPDLSGLSRGLGRLQDGNRDGSLFNNRGNGSRGDLGDLLRNWGSSGMGGFPGNYYGDRYRREDSMAKAYRDAAIANAVVGLVGIMVTASQQQNHVVAAPAPVAVMSPPPGRWERQTVVLEPARYEQYQEWIPELFDSRTGQQVGGGYYESRTRLVPEVTGFRDVWVTP